MARAPRRSPPAGRAPAVVYAADGAVATGSGRYRKKLITSTQISHTRNTVNPIVKIAAASVATIKPATIHPSAITRLAHPNPAGNTPVRSAATPDAATRTAT